MSTTAAPSSSSSHGMQVDNTRAIAIPVLMIIALLLAIFFTRHSLLSAAENAKSDFRKGILFFGGCITTLMSVFLLPTAAWSYAAASSLFAYMSTLLCTPGILDTHAETFFALYLGWLLTLVGIPDLWSDGIIAQLADCSKWFPVKTDMCKDSWITYTTIIAICVVIVNFFCVIALMSLVFQASDSPYQEITDDGTGNNNANSNIHNANVAVSSPNNAYQNMGSS